MYSCFYNNVTSSGFGCIRVVCFYNNVTPSGFWLFCYNVETLHVTSLRVNILLNCLLQIFRPTWLWLVLQNGIPLGMFRSVEESGKGKTGMP